ncbi:FdhF/YdeP family oxidoreductase [Psychrobacter frigidicola]|uniref:FdhF/YdeP family oxidoreductase n=1 Tax=Psychrobacter frigidicola TaxID=45611 RepID=A0A5C7A4P0_9GAMM|nr:FdhF/YdeP family oxidoreductase [Psychrobacter frigidicola]TXD97574.1 FdhF/YdeP family oxidoreductase [Psychrobacter frigidicola]
MRKIPIYKHPAAGWSALISSARKLMDYQAFLRGSLSVLSSNQPKGGFDCPGCAWPDHKSHKALDVCETGIKVLASEAMSIRTDAKFFARHTVTELQGWTGYELEHSGRLSEPMHYDAAQDRYVPISWENAYVRIAEQLKKLDSPDEAMFYTSGRVTNEPAFMYQLLVRCFGTNNLPDCSNMCHEPTSVMLGKQLGLGKATVILEDFEQAKLIIMFGQNPATNHPRMLEMLAHAHKQGCRILSVNPMREQGLKAFRNPQKPTHLLGNSDDMVDDVIQIQIGGDAALLTGMAKWLTKNGKVNSDFINTHTSGYEALDTWLRQQSWEDVVRGCGISKEEIISIARLVAESPGTICTWGMGITQHVQGDDNVAMITNLLLLMGMIGIDGGGASPVRGHSNVQGDRTMGIHERPSQSLLDSMEKTFNHPMPQEDGFDVINGAKALIEGKIKAFMSMGGNYAVAAPDTSAIQQALTSNQLNVFVATKLNETMLYPGVDNLILPCVSRTERLITTKGEQFATIEDSMCKIVATQGRLNPISKTLKSEAQIVADIATHLFGSESKIPWQAMGADFDVTRDYIAQAIEGFEDFNQRIRAEDRGFYLYHPARHREWHTESGKAQFEVPKYPITYVATQMAERTSKLVADSKHANSLNSDVNDAQSISIDDSQNQAQSSEQAIWQLTSVRSHDQFNTMIFGFQDRYRQTDRRDVLFMHPDEMRRLGWQKGDTVRVLRQDSKGQQRTLGPLILTEMDIAANAVATYYPECNDLIDLDTHAPDSRIPSYKSLTVVLERVSADELVASA